MNLIINGEQQETEATTLQDLLSELSISMDGIAVALNEQVISKHNWPNSSLKQNDAVLIITATQGG